MFGRNAAIVDIVGNDKTGRAIASAKNNLKGLGRTSKAVMGSLGIGVGIGAITRITKEAIDYGSAITDAAAATRTGIEEYQVLKYAAQEAGADMGKVTTALAKIQKATNDAKNGLTTYTRAFDALGINLDQFQRLSPDRQFEALGIAMVNSKDQATAYASVLDIIGSRNAPRLMEVLKRLGTDGFDAMAIAAKNAGQVMSEETAQGLDAAADAIARLKTQMTIATGEAIIFFDRVIKGEEGMRAAAEATAEAFLKTKTQAMQDALRAQKELDWVIKSGGDQDEIDLYKTILEEKKEIVREEQKQLDLVKKRAAEEEGILAHIAGLNKTGHAGKNSMDMLFDEMLGLTKRGTGKPTAADGTPSLQSILGLTGPSAYQSSGMPSAGQSTNPYSAKPGHVYSNFMAQKAQSASGSGMQGAVEAMNKGGNSIEALAASILKFVKRLEIAEQQIANAR